MKPSRLRCCHRSKSKKMYVPYKSKSVTLCTFQCQQQQQHEPAHNRRKSASAPRDAETRSRIWCETATTCSSASSPPCTEPWCPGGMESSVNIDNNLTTTNRTYLHVIKHEEQYLRREVLVELQIVEMRQIHVREGGTRWHGQLRRELAELSVCGKEDTLATMTTTWPSTYRSLCESEISRGWREALSSSCMCMYSFE